MIPNLTRKGLYQFKIPQLSGGINLKEDIAYIKENQLSDCSNMWFKDGALKTRPAIRQTNTFQQSKKGAQLQAKNFNTVVMDGEKYTLECEKFISSKTDVSCEYYLDLKLCSKTDTILLGRIYPDVPELDDFNAFSIIYKNDIYVYFRYYDIIDEGFVNLVYRFTKLGYKCFSSAEYIHPRNMYAPLILTNCTGCYKDSGSANTLISKGATQMEGFNLLGNYYKMEFSTYDNSSTGYRYFKTGDNGEIIDTKTYMEYSLPYTSKETTGEIFVEYFDKAGVIQKHKVNVPTNNPTVESTVGADGLYLHAFLKGNIVHFTFNTIGDALEYQPHTISIDDYVHNNMTVTAPCKNTDENVKKVMGMTEAIWYGNNSLGVNGGSRLFLCGNVDENEKALVVWSDFENPFYFSESNYAYVGDKTQKTTCFGRQGSSLIVFKEHQIYSCDYAVNGVSAEELIEQSAIDLSGLISGFTFKMIHSKIGCDCPQTIQLCFNKLLWATSDGKVYNLTDRNQYSERNVVSVSDAIERSLSTKNMKSACSADWNGYYLLFVGSNVYAMDYNSYEYMGISTYSLKRSVSALPAWYLWQLPFNVQAVCGDDENMLICFLKEDNKNCANIIRGYFDFNETADFLEENFDIVSKIRTCLFSFNNPEKFKRISKVTFNLASKQSANVSVKCINEQGTSNTHFLNLLGKTFDGLIRGTRQIIPCLKIFRGIAFELSSRDYFELKEITINFKELNTAK